MNKVDWTNPGGFPELLNDLEFDQLAVREAITGLLSAYGVSTPNTFILTGCNTSGLSILPGWIVINGEVCRFDGQALSLVALPNVLVWTILETNDPDGQKSMESTAIVQAYKIRRATIIVVDTSVVIPGGYVPFGSTETVKNKMVSLVSQDNPAAELAAKILAVIAASGLYATVAQEAKKVIGAVGQPAYTANFSEYNVNNPLVFWKDTIGNVHIQGAVKCDTTSGGDLVITTLPAGYRPPTGQLHYFPIYGTSGNKVAHIKDTGEFKITAPTATAVVFVQMSFRP